MKLRTFFTILLLLAGLSAVAAFVFTNRDVLGQEVYLWGGLATNVGFALLTALVVGIVVTFLVGGWREWGLVIERSRLRKVEKKSGVIEEEYSRGLVAVLEGRDAEALAHFRAVLELDSRHFNTLINLGDVLRSQGRHAEAIEYHRKARHLKEDSTRPLYALVEDFEEKGEIDQARIVLGQIIGLRKNSVAALRKLRSLHMKEGNWDNALEAHQKVTKLAGPQDPNRDADLRTGPGIRYQIAVEQLGRGKKREAISGLRRLVKENPRFIPAQLKLGEALGAQGQEKEAIAVWHAGFLATGAPIFLMSLEDHFLGREEPLAAIEALKRCVSECAKDALPRFYLGKLYFRLEMLDDALSVLNSLKGRTSYTPSLHYLLGRIHERRRNFDQASAEYRNVIREMDLVHLDYRCHACEATSADWSDRCANCGEWNSMGVNFREEITPEELGLSVAPVYTSRR